MQSNFHPQKIARRAREAFTLIELLVSMAVLSLLMVMVFSMVDQTQQTWNIARTRVSQFREARTAFESVTRSLRQATLNVYWDYDYGDWKYTTSPTTPLQPERYQRQSELHFLCGPSTELLGNVQGANRRPGHSIFFQVAGGFGTTEDSEQLNDLLNARGYFVEYGEDSAFKPSFLLSETKPRWRFRLMELRPPTENLLVYLRDLKAQGQQGIGAGKNALRAWFTDQMGLEFAGGQIKRPIAENIISVFFLPKLPENDPRQWTLAPDYVYDSREWQYSGGSDRTADDRIRYSKNQLPPLIEVTMVAVDEKSMIRYQQQNQGSNSTMPEFVPDDLFQNYSDYRDFLDDLDALKTALDDLKISYRVFNQTVPMRGAGWSESS